MKLFEIQKSLQAVLKGTWDDQEINEIKMDSREIEKGDVFLAYGHGSSYIEEAIKKGAIAIITDQQCEIKSIPILKVDDSLVALTQLGYLKRKSFHGKVIAITGSNGKTSTKELLQFLLSSNKRVLANFESENNHIGVPKTLLKVNSQYDYVVLELGMNHAGEIRALSKMVYPDIGIITNIGTSHLGNLGSQENIFKAKMELVEGNPNMELFVNGLDIYLKTVDAHQVYLEYESTGSIPSINLNLACKVCEYLGYRKEEIQNRVKAFKGVSSRMEKIAIHDKYVVDDAYNASYESICYGLEQIEKYPYRKVMILGDILELGSFSQEIHKKIYQEILKYADIFLITVGKETSVLENECHFSTIEELRNFLSSFSWLPHDMIYLKASHKIGLSQLVSFFQEIL